MQKYYFAITEQTSRVQAGEARALKSSAPPLKGGREYERATAEFGIVQICERIQSVQLHEGASQKSQFITAEWALIDSLIENCSAGMLGANDVEGRHVTSGGPCQSASQSVGSSLWCTALAFPEEPMEW